MLKLNMIINTRTASLEECRAKQDVVLCICKDLMKRSGDYGILSEDRKKLRDLCLDYWQLYHELDWFGMELVQEMEFIEEDNDGN